VVIYMACIDGVSMHSMCMFPSHVCGRDAYCAMSWQWRTLCANEQSQSSIGDVVPSNFLLITKNT
jgi:hypothetical protein